MTNAAAGVVVARIAAIWLTLQGAVQVLRDLRPFPGIFAHFDLDRAFGLGGQALPLVAGVALWFGARRFAAATELDAIEIEIDAEDDAAAEDEPSEERGDLVYPIIVAAVSLIGIWFAVSAAPGVLYQIAALVMGPELVYAGWQGEAGSFYTSEGLYLGLRLIEMGLGLALLVRRTQIADAIDPDTATDTPWPAP